MSDEAPPPESAPASERPAPETPPPSEPRPGPAPSPPAQPTTPGAKATAPEAIGPELPTIASAVPEGPAPTTGGSRPTADGSLSTAGLIRLAGGFYAIVVVFAFGYAFFDRISRDAADSDGAFLGLALPSIGSLLSGVGLGLVIVGVVHVGMRILPAVEIAGRHFARILGPLTWRDALLLAAFSSVGEELLFRGALWGHLGLIGTSCLFGLVHILPRKALWAYPLFALLAGLLFGILRTIPPGFGSVFPPILAHFTINFLNLWWLGHNYARLTDPSVKTLMADA